MLTAVNMVPTTNSIIDLSSRLLQINLLGILKKSTDRQADADNRL